MRAAFFVSFLFCAASLPSRADEPELPVSAPEAEGLRSDELIRLTTWIRDNPSFPVFSILISRHGKLVYELYTGSIDRDDAHYLMSVTKSVLSALVGIAIDRKLIRSAEASIAELLPRALFASEKDVARFQSLTLRRVMGMAGVDAPDPPRVRTPEAIARYRLFWSAPSRLAVVLHQPILTAAPFQYNDSTPLLAVGALTYATKMSALAFAEEALFGPLGFRHYEWMHRDASGMENGGYGLRLRPIDMQKLGLLYLNKGQWRGRRLLSESWVNQSFQPWNRSARSNGQPDYGWFWWRDDFGPGWTAHVANGWKGQRIAVIPDQQIVITTTACIEDGSEDAFFSELVNKVVKPSVEHGAAGGNAAAAATLARLLDEVHRGPARFADFIEYRMVPSAAPKQPR